MFMGTSPIMMPFNFLEVGPGDWIWVMQLNGQGGVGLIFGGSSWTHGSRIFHHWVIRVGENGFVVFGAEIAGAGWGEDHSEVRF